MPRIYKPTKNTNVRTPLDGDKIKEAVLCVIRDGATFKGTAKKFNLNVMTLKRYVRAQMASNGEISFVPNYHKSQIFTKAEEDMLSGYLEKASKLHHGLTSKQTRQFAYEYALYRIRLRNQVFHMGESSLP